MDALFPAHELSLTIGREYAGQCQLLYFGSYPSWEVVKARFVELRELL